MNLQSFHKKIAAVTGLIGIAATAAGQEAASDAPKVVTSNNNQLAILLVVMSLVLAFVIWGMGQVLVAMSRQLVEKQKAATKTVTVLLLMIGMLASSSTFAQTTPAADAATSVVANYGGLSSSTFYMFLAVVVMEVIAIFFLLLAINRIFAELNPKKEVAASNVPSWWTNLDKKLFTRAVPIEKEADVMLDHDYDGIRELDNALPPWWKYGFYVTIVIGFIYLFNFHVMGSGKNPTQEYLAEMEKAETEKAIYEAGNKEKVDENNVPMADAAGLAMAQQVFDAKCSACHGKAGEGGAGPNLTDDYWLHKGSLNDIFHTIKYGYPDKGMQSWASVYSPKEISFLASYVKRLHGTHPANAKAPQGDLYADAPSAAAASDSAKVAPKADSSVAALKK